MNANFIYTLICVLYLLFVFILKAVTGLILSIL